MSVPHSPGENGIYGRANEQHFNGVSPDAIAITKNPVGHARTKHINIRYHYICEVVQNGIVDLLYCPSEEIKADIIKLLTKPLPRERFKMLCEAMGMVVLSHKQPVN